MLFENSIVCHVFYAIESWGLRVFCVWFLGLVLFWFAWLLAVVVGGWVGLCGLVFWAFVLTVDPGWPVWVGWGFVGFVWRV